MKRLLPLVAMFVAAPIAFAQSGAMKGMEMNEAKPAASAKSHKGAGEVKSVDANAGTVTLAHEPIQSLKWPSMTMRFKAKDKAMVEKLKPGQKVEFSFVQAGKDFVLTEIK